jgi:hypothetical protein
MTSKRIAYLAQLLAMVVLSLALVLPVAAKDPEVNVGAVEARLSAATLLAPRNLRAGTITEKSILLQWQDLSIGETSNQLEILDRNTGATSYRTLGRNTTTYELHDLTPSDRFTFRLRACDDTLCSAWSNAVDVTTQVDVRVELSWGAALCDLDLHVRTPGGQDIFFGNRGNIFAAPFVRLTEDDRGSGPAFESTLIDRGPGTYKIAVHNFGGCRALAGSDARVRIFQGHKVLGDFVVPATGTGSYWYVANLTGSQVTPVNTLSSSLPI